MIHLHRFAWHPKFGTVGILHVARAHADGRVTMLQLFTLEDPRRENQVGRSCIPAGEYDVRRDHSGRHQVYQVLDVPGRTAIEFHAGSTHEQTAGCILLGRGYDLRVSSWKLLESGLAVSSFLDAMGDRDDSLIITEAR